MLAARLRALVEEAAYPRNRRDHPRAMEGMEAWLADGFAAMGWQVQRHRFVAHGLEGVNLVARLAGDSDETRVVGAHYDTLPETPGADDNTASLACLLELARLLPEGPLPRTVLLVAFDMEEWGLDGARALAPELARDHRLEGVVVYESMGYIDRAPGSQKVPDGMAQLFPDVVRRLEASGYAGDTTVIVHRESSERIARSLARGLGDPALLLCDPGIGPLGRHFGRSDHLPFWELGVPALMVTDSADFRNPHYHQPSDLPDTLDYERLALIVEATRGWLLEKESLAQV